MVRVDGGREFLLGDHNVDVIADEWSISLKINNKSQEFTLHIEQPFQIEQDPEADSRHYVNDIKQLSRLVQGQGKIKNIIAFENGSLTINLNDGAVVKVEGSDEFEPWSLASTDGLRLVSTPGHKLTIWQPEA